MAGSVSHLVRWQLWRGDTLITAHVREYHLMPSDSLDDIEPPTWNPYDPNMPHGYPDGYEWRRATL